MEWYIKHPCTSKEIRCKSFNDCLQWFEGHNLPYIKENNIREPIEVSNMRMELYFKDK